jgi:Protein of unknown function (DUF1592)/Protein of unknown function (DUF1588)/Protein of unknown function (DUF1587)/Protein of unknown function (DUF1585)/Protein of unknown function (DUF1595)/Planctomycete cytochrome C
MYRPNPFIKSRSRKSLSLRWVGLVTAAALRAAAPADEALAPDHDWSKVRPVLEKSCYECHGGKKTKGGVNLKQLDADPLMDKEFTLWNKVKEAIRAGDMPPEEKPELAKADKDEITGWLGHNLEATIRAHAGDPGVVTVRRLTNVEFDNTIRDLTGIDYGFGREFLPDGGGGEGFSNIGDVLFTSPQQLDKYLTAARKLTDHATILPGSGITFQEQRVGLRGPEQLRDQAEQALYVWYQKMAGPYLPKDGEDMRQADYMLACWKFKHRDLTGAGSLEELAKANHLSSAFLDNWWSILNATLPKSRFLDLTRVAWRELPGPDPAQPAQVPEPVQKKILEIQAQQLSWWGDMKRPGSGVQRRQQDADGLRPYDFHADVKGRKTVHIVVGDLGDGNRGDFVKFESLSLECGKKHELYLDWLNRRLREDRKALAALQTPPAPASSPTSPAPNLSSKPALTLEELNRRIAEAESTLARFGKHPLGAVVDHNMLVVHAPEVVTLPLPDDATKFHASGRLDLDTPEAEFATVQWMATGDTPPDPTKVIPGVLTMWKRQTKAAAETMNEFNVMKIAFPDEFLRRMEEVARNYMRNGKAASVYYFSDEQLAALLPAREKERFSAMMADWRLLSRNRLTPKDEAGWDQALQQDAARFAALAWRRPLTKDETDELIAVYTAARARDLDRESAAREVLVGVLVSPNFLFKLEDAEQPGEHRLTAWEMASRLSYFIWSSMPDATLRAATADGSIFQPEVLAREVKRMLADPRAGALAEEFAGQWLEFHGFDKINTVDTNRFPEFTPELRRDMNRETEEFLTHLVREDRPVRDIILADYTYLNERMAAYYGIPGVKGEDFQKVSVAAWHRGGVLGMASMLTKTSYPQRTSPVLRGNWLLRSVLGTPTPPPPADVPKLDESSAQAKTVRERLEAHRANRTCAVCHDKIDPLGFALESFDPIGRFREKDEAGLQIDTTGTLKDGTAFNGIDGLRNYLATRQADFDKLFCRKLVGFALGRSLSPTDQPLFDTMLAQLNKSGDRFSAAVLAIAESRQFQNRRND